MSEPLRDVRAVDGLWSSSDPARRSAVLVARAGVVDRLVLAQTMVPRALRIVVVAAGPSAPPCPHVAAHATGSAVDLTCHVDGSAALEPDPWTATPPVGWPAVAAALTAVGLVNSPPWFHWSFGDSAWRARQP